MTPTVHSDPQMRLDESLVRRTGPTLQPRARGTLRLRIQPTPHTSLPAGLWGVGAPTLI